MTLIHASTLHVAMAANMSYAMGAIKERFEIQHPGTKLQVILGSSGKLAAQIRNGAPIDLFLSANMQYPQALDAVGLTSGRAVVYAKGVLVLLSAQPRAFANGLALLEEKEIQKIAIANPKTAPYGTAAVEALKHAGVYEKLKEKFVYGESVSQTITYATRAADIGIVAKSALFSPQMKQFEKGVHWIDVDPKLYTPIAQGMVLLKHAENNEEAQAFYDFMQGEDARRILQTYGYRLP